MKERIFIGSYPAGIVFSDRTVCEFGDYKKLAFLPYKTLILEIKKDCPVELIPEIKASAAIIQKQNGKEFVISGCGQTVLLGR